MARLITFFALAFGISWTAWAVAALLHGRHGPAVDQALLYAGIPGPGIAALLLLHWRGSAAQRRDFYRRIYQVERVAPRWLALVLLLYPLLTALAVTLHWLGGGALPDPARLLQRLTDPGLLLGSVAILLLLGPLPEEPGWRGYALDRLQSRLGGLGASLVLGAAWGLWHLPLFVVPGTYQFALGLGSAGFWLFMLTALAASVVMTCVHNHTARSILAAILFHASLNVTRDSLPLGQDAELIRTTLLVAVALWLMWRTANSAGMARA